MTRRIRGVGEIAGRFDAFVVDQFGVIHDGEKPYSGALEALALLKRRGPVVLVSNSGKRAAANEARLERLGVPRGLYDAFVSSGEVAHAMLAEGAFLLPSRAPVLVVSRGDGAAALDGLDLRPTGDAREAAMVLIAGSEAERVPVARIVERLRPAAERGVPALCTNPDRHMLAAGGIHPGAGAIAEAYAAMGGPVTWIGKPHPAIFERAGAALGGVAWPGTLGIGDSAEHDVAGIRRMGGAALLVETGVAGMGDGPEPDYAMATLRP